MNRHPLLPDPSAARRPIPIPSVPMPDDSRWEYRRIVRNLRTEDAPDEIELNALGTDAWELVGLFCDSPFLYLFFKRPV